MKKGWIIFILIVVIVIGIITVVTINANAKLADEIEALIDMENIDYYQGHDVRSANSYTLYVEVDERFDGLSTDEKIDIARQYFNDYNNHIKFFGYKYKYNKDSDTYRLIDLTIYLSSKNNSYRINGLTFYDEKGESYAFDQKSDEQKQKEKDQHDDFIASLKNKIPYKGLSEYYISKTSWGGADEIEKCKDYDKLRPSHQSKEYRWYSKKDDMIHTKYVYVLNGEVIRVDEYETPISVMNSEAIAKINSYINDK